MHGVSIPSGLPKPFHLPMPRIQQRTRPGFNSKRTSQAISPMLLATELWSLAKFQFQADFPSHFTPENPSFKLEKFTVSIPSGLPKPFHLSSKIAMLSNNLGFNSKRTSQAISPFNLSNR